MFPSAVLPPSRQPRLKLTPKASLRYATKPPATRGLYLWSCPWGSSQDKSEDNEHTHTTVDGADPSRDADQAADIHLVTLPAVTALAMSYRAASGLAPTYKIIRCKIVIHFSPCFQILTPT